MLTIIRGVPGSGKSTLAIALVHAKPHTRWVEADDFMTDAEGNYKFDPSKLAYCHTQCQDEARAALRDGLDVIVSNTFTQRWEYQPYLDMAKQYGADVQVIEVHGNFHNVHNVPADKVQAMKDRWESHK